MKMQLAITLKRHVPSQTKQRENKQTENSEVVQTCWVVVDISDYLHWRCPCFGRNISAMFK